MYWRTLVHNIFLWSFNMYIVYKDILFCIFMNSYLFLLCKGSASLFKEPGLALLFPCRTFLFSISTYSPLCYFLLSTFFGFNLQYFFYILAMGAWLYIFYMWHKVYLKSEDHLQTDKSNCQLHQSPNLFFICKELEISKKRATITF